jgi:hypothetical protein
LVSALPHILCTEEDTSCWKSVMPGFVGRGVHGTRAPRPSTTATPARIPSSWNLRAPARRREWGLCAQEWGREGGMGERESVGERERERETARARARARASER